MIDSRVPWIVRDARSLAAQIKYIAKVIKDTTAPPGDERRPFYEYLATALRHKSDMVMFQARGNKTPSVKATLVPMGPQCSYGGCHVPGVRTPTA